jgi:formate hydrogenlyase subunit 5
MTEEQRGHAQKYTEPLRAKFGSAILEETWETPSQATVTVDLGHLPDVVEDLYYNYGGWLSSVAGVDERRLNGNFALNYILSMEGNEDPKDNMWLTVRALVPPHQPEFPSVTPRVPAATWYERDARDLLGIHPVGHPDPRRLTLSDDWPDNFHPLRKDMDYRCRPEPVTEEDNFTFIDAPGEGLMEVPLGPLHVTSDEPGHFRLFVDGETIVDADYRLFYNHRGIEKIAENRLDYDQVHFIAERICGICGYAHSIAYTETIENAIGLEVPERAKYIRTLYLEVERLHSHLLNIGLACHFIGFDTGFMHLFRVREKSMEMAEILTGARKTYGMNLIGGVRKDVLKEEREQTLKLLAEIKTEYDNLVAILLDTPQLFHRTQGVGILEKKVARDHSPVGPTVRGSGFARDTRRDHPYCSYDKVPFKVITHEGMDVLGRTLVRALEVYEVMAIIEHCLKEMPEGPILVEGFEYKPYRHAVSAVEAPRGEDIHFLITDTNQKVYRWRPRASTFNNWPPLRYMLRGNVFSNAPLIVASLDPCYSCTERVTVVDIRKQKSKVIPYKELERYCIEQKDSPLKS